MSRPLLWLLLAGCNRSTPSPPPPQPPHGAVEGPSQGLERDLERTRSFAASRPLEERPLADGFQRPEGVGSLRAEACGACHPEIYAEWAVSTHRHAWDDPQFQAEITKSDNLWLCRNCHTPLRSQQPHWPVGLVGGDVEAPELVPNPAFDEALMHEGVTCAGCHVRQGTIHGPGLSNSSPPHPVEPEPTLRSGEICLRCHQAERVYPAKTFVCTFTTGEEWRQSPQASQGETCVSCHMPQVTRPAALGGPERTVRRHWFKGSGVPKFPDRAPPQDAPPSPGLALELGQANGALEVRLRNEGAGHALPTGDPERWIQIDATFFDGSGAELEPRWSTRIGQEWRWEPEPKRMSDNRLAPHEARVERVAVPQGAAKVTVRASHHRMSEENARWHGLSDYPLSIQTHEQHLDLSP